MMNVPGERVVVMENHDEAYHVWRRAGVSGRVLVHVDARHDMLPADFVSHAVRDGIVREVVWVVPDGWWQDRIDRREVLSQIETLRREDSDPPPRQVAPDAIRAVVRGLPLTVCSLDSLPAIDAPVLLDVDAAYFLFRHVTRLPEDALSIEPWCWPEQAIARLRLRGFDVDWATVAYSVNSGCTPLRWKFLADEVASLLRGDPPTAASSAFRYVRRGAELARAGDAAAAEAVYREAAGDSAAAAYHLAHLLAAAGRLAEARAFYDGGCALDPAYRTSIDSRGILHEFRDRPPRAIETMDATLERLLQIDPADAYAQFALGRIASSRERWTDAERFFQGALACGGPRSEAAASLGDTLLRLGRTSEAIDAYEESVRLAFEGHQGLAPRVITASMQARLARLYERSGDRQRAIDAYRRSAVHPQRAWAAHVHLARLHLRGREWRSAARHGRQAVAWVPRLLRRAVRRTRLSAGSR